MKRLTVIAVAVGAVLAGCASTSGGRGEPARGHDHGAGDQAGMMAGMCPMNVEGAKVAATEVVGGIGLSFTTTTGDVAELRQRVRRMADRHNQPGGHMMMGNHGAPGADAGPQQGAQAEAGPEDAGRSEMMGGAMKMPAATGSVEDMEGGARLVLQPKDPAQLEALREHVRVKAQRMAAGECPMKSLRSGSEPAEGARYPVHG